MPSYKSHGYTAVKTCCCVRDVLQGNKLFITVIIQHNLDTVRNIDRFCQFEDSQFEFEHTLCIQLRLNFSFLFSLQSIALSRSAAYQSVKPIAADVLASCGVDKCRLCILANSCKCMQHGIKGIIQHSSRRAVGSVILINQSYSTQ